MHRQIRENIDWVGVVDWNVRDFHGYETLRGSTYNAYLVRDGKTALIDTVKAPFAPALLANVRGLTDLAKVDYLVCHHAEPDHAGGMSQVVAALPNATVVCDAKCRTVLERYHDTRAWRFQVVSDGQELPLGRRTLRFFETAMVHWPESMASYVPQEKLLFSMDAFGQHLASSGRFDDEEPLDLVMAEAKTYYANILMLYGRPIAQAIERLSTVPIEVVCPSHGVIWRKNLNRILLAYRDWVALRSAPKVLVVYDTMWKSTEAMAQAILEGASRPPVKAKLLNVRSTSSTVLATETLDAACLAVGSPTLNNTIMPQVAAALTYLKGLRPAGKTGMFFGSYGWGRTGAASDATALLEAMKLEILREPLLSQYAPDEEILAQCRQAGRALAERAMQRAGQAS